MLSLFALPKPFDGHIGLIQENALASWSKLPNTQVILLGDDAGVAEAAARHGFQHVPDVEKNDQGTPMVDDIFAKAQQLARGEIVAYVNADIILPPTLPQVIATAEHHFGDFLLVGQRWDLDVTERINFDDPAWITQLKLDVVTRGCLHAQSGIDYFIFRKGFYGHVPAFAIGRMAWDNWLVLHAKERGAAVVDASEAIFIVHQNHDYNHVAGGQGNVWKGPETDANRKLFGLPSGQPGYIQNAASWRMTPTTLVPVQKAPPEALQGFTVTPWQQVVELVTQAVEARDLAKAHKLLDDAQPHHGGLEEYHYVRAVVLANQGDVKRAAESARQAMRVNPGSEPARKLLEQLGEDASTTWASAQASQQVRSDKPAPSAHATPPRVPNPATSLSPRDTRQGSLDRTLDRLLITDADLLGKRVLDLGAGERLPQRVDRLAGTMIIARNQDADSAPAMRTGVSTIHSYSLHELPSHLNGQAVDVVLIPDLHVHGTAAGDVLGLALGSVENGGFIVASLVADGPERLSIVKQLEQHARIEVEELFELPDPRNQPIDPDSLKAYNFQRTDRDREAVLLIRMKRGVAPEQVTETTAPHTLEGSLHPMVKHGAERDREAVTTTSERVDEAVKTMTADPLKAAQLLRKSVDASYVELALTRDDKGEGHA